MANEETELVAVAALMLAEHSENPFAEPAVAGIAVDAFMPEPEVSIRGNVNGVLMMTSSRSTR